MVLEVGRFMTETSLYFIEANIFRGLSQLSRKTQLCVRAAWTGQSLVFWVLCFLWKCIKNWAYNFTKSWTGCFLGPEAFKSWCEGRQVELIFFTNARREAQNFFVFSWLCLVKSLLLRLPFFYIKFCLRLQSNKSRHSLVGHMWRGGGGVEGMRGWGGGLGRGVPSRPSIFDPWSD